jgi:uncharacterized protein (TIGR03435 family)
MADLLGLTPIYGRSKEAENTGSVTEAELKQVLQALLMERFNLQVHRELIEVSGFALVVSKSGSKINEDLGEDANEPIMRGGPEGLVYKKAPLSMFAGFLSGPAGEPVVDRTGLTGVFSFKFQPPHSR